MEAPSNEDPTTTSGPTADTTAVEADASTTTIRSLNDLPEHLLIDILSCLPTIDAIKTSSISRRWRNLWSSVHSISFSYDLFPPSECPFETRRRFVDYVNQTLILRHHPPPQSPPLLTTFRLRFDFKEYAYSYLVESWIHYAVSRGVRNLDIDFYIDPKYHINLLEGEPYFQFPFYALRKGRVRVFKLLYCGLILPADMSGGVKFASLRSLFLSHVDLIGQVSDLLIGCPNLESLSLKSCWGLENVKIRGMKIEKLSLGYFHREEDSDTSIEIDCPNLRMLDISFYEVGKYTLNNANALVEASVYFAHREKYYGFWSKVVNLLGNVRKLTVQNWWFKLLEPEGPANLKFHNLMWLELQTQYLKSELHGIAALLEVCPNLDTLILGYLFKLEEEDESISEELLNKPIKLSLPRLRQAKMMAFTGTENENLLLSLLMTDAKVCEKIVVVPVRCAEVAHPPRVYRRRPNGA